MIRSLQFTITKEYSGWTVGDYLKHLGITSKSIINLKKTPNGIQLNHVWAYVNELLKDNDLLEIHIEEHNSSQQIVSSNLPLKIVYEDEDIIIVNKDANMPIHPSQNNYDNTVANALAYYFEQQNKPFVFRCTNRLDKDTTGLTLISKHQIAGGILSSMVAKREIKRCYLAICTDDGTLPLLGTIDAPIARKNDSIIERIVDFEKGEHAITHYTKISHSKENNLSLVRLQLETGRTHQIRVHMKHLGYPLIGDHLYQTDLQHISRQALHSYSLAFTHPITRESLYFEAPLPKDMERLFRLP